jgi:cytoskeleton protein RodZ
MVSEAPASDAAGSASGPGHRLRAARESRHLSREDIAAQLRLDVRIIEALERDDYQALPSPVFVRGYLRNCATLLGMDATELLGEGGPVVRPEVSARPGWSAARRPMRLPRIPWRVLGVLLLIGILGAAFAAWGPALVNRFRGSTPAADEEAEHRLRLPGQTSSPEDEASPSLLPDDPPATDESDGSPGAKNGLSVEPPANEVAAIQMPTVLSPPAEAREEEGLLVTDEVSATEPPLDEVAAAAVPVLPADAPAATLTVELKFQQDSWVEMEGADGKRLLFGLMKSGQNQRIEGQPPVSVVLGNSPGVEIMVDGKPFDPSRHSHGGVSRFRLERD